MRNVRLASEVDPIAEWNDIIGVNSPAYGHLPGRDTALDRRRPRGSIVITSSTRG